MFIQGTREWIGKEAYTFLYIRKTIERKLLSLGYEYFYGGAVSKKTIYKKYSDMLGEDFFNIFVDFNFKNNNLIFSPEYTFRVFEYLDRNNLFTDTGKKVFYSQEMMRNEPYDEIKNGKTFSFWQIGYELFGGKDIDLSVECFLTLNKCLSSLFPKKLYYRITDKYIFDALCEKYDVSNKANILVLLDESDENGSIFYEKYINNGGNTKFASDMRTLLDLSMDGKLDFDILRKYTNGTKAIDAISNLEKIYNKIKDTSKDIEIEIVAAMPKTWMAYTSFMFDARLYDYDKAIAGGGNLFINPKNPNCIHSGAGIGVTRIAEIMNNE